MDMNSYLVEVVIKNRLADARADAARYHLLAASGARESRLWGALKSALLRVGRWIGRRGAVSPRHA